jgi:hypothetical protein
MASWTIYLVNDPDLAFASLKTEKCQFLFQVFYSSIRIVSVVLFLVLEVSDLYLS